MKTFFITIGISKNGDINLLSKMYVRHEWALDIAKSCRGSYLSTWVLKLQVYGSRLTAISKLDRFGNRQAKAQVDIAKLAKALGLRGPQ